MSGIDEKVYEAYFGKPVQEDTDGNHQPAIEKQFNALVYDTPDARRLHTREITPGVEYNNVHIRMMADNNIDEIEQLADILKRLCNAAWGEGWGELSPDLKKGEDSSTLVLPQITVEINTREIDEAFGAVKPRLTNIVNEVDDNGDETGDAFLIYRQWFACNVEFNFYGRTNKEARDLRKRFENLMTVYAGYLKRQGISEMWFESEAHPKCSLNYDERAFMRCIYYYIRFEAITPIRQSVINRVNTEIGVGELNTEKVRTMLQQSKQSTIDLDFFDGDTGITFIDND